MKRFALAAACCILMSATLSPAVIYNWQTGQVIPGTESITPAPGVDLSGWNTSTRNLFYASLNGCNLSGSTFASSWVSRANFTGANLQGANLSNTGGENVNFTNANLSTADLTAAYLAGGTFTGAIFAFSALAKEQLYSTASYKNKSLGSIDLTRANLTGYDLSGQNMTGARLGAATMTGANLTHASLSSANLTSVNMTGADLSFADMRGANLSGVVGTATRRNTIWADGSIWMDNNTQGLHLLSGEHLKVANGSAVTANGNFTMQEGATLQMGLYTTQCSTIHIGGNIDLAGTLEISWWRSWIDPQMIGKEFRLFNWNGNLSAGDCFDSIVITSNYDPRYTATWDTSRLYTDGVIVLNEVPEPMTLTLLALGLPLLRRKKRKNLN